jgi:hypothetical protein
MLNRLAECHCWRIILQPMVTCVSQLPRKTRQSDPLLTLLQNTLVNFAVSYTIIGILMGITGLYSLGFSYGGPVSVVSVIPPLFNQAAVSLNLDVMMYTFLAPHHLA